MEHRDIKSAPNGVGDRLEREDEFSPCSGLGYDSMSPPSNSDPRVGLRRSGRHTYGIQARVVRKSLVLLLSRVGCILLRGSTRLRRRRCCPLATSE